MKRFIPRLRVNPIIVKELRSRMRGPRPFITLTLILLVTGGIMYVLLQIVLAASQTSSVLSPQIGQSMFAVLAYLELFMICAITPAVTAGAISGEKEKQTYEMLMATPLSPARILWGKLISAMSYVLLLIFAAVPLASVVFIFGGVDPTDMLRVLIILLVIAISLGILGLFMSALFGRTGWATVASFVAVVFLTFGPLLIALLVGVIQQHEPPRWLLAPSPVSMLAGALAPALGNNNGNGIASIFFTLSGAWNLGINPVSQTDIPRPLYHYSLPFYLGMSLVLYLLSARLVQPARRFKFRAKEILLGAAALILFCGLTAAAFYMTADRYELAVQNLGIQPTVVPFIGPNSPIQGAPDTKVIQVQPVGLTPTPPAVVIETLPASTSEVDTPLDLDTQVEIYSAVARKLFLNDNTLGGAPKWTVLFLAQTTNDGIGDPNNPKTAPGEISGKTQNGITGALKDLSVEIRWTSSLNDVPKDAKDGSVLNGTGTVITFGNLHPQADGTVQVPASLYFASLGATGKTYILSKVDGKWVVTGTTGVEWTS